MGTMTRREWFVTGGLAAAAFAVPRALLAAAGAPLIGQLAVPSTRAAEIVTWSPRAPRGVALFSHDAGSRPQAHPFLVDLLGRAGFAVLAPVHVDAELRETSFPARIEDLFAAAARAESLYAGLPVIAIGEGYGALVAMCLGGALDRRLRVPAVGAVLALDPVTGSDGVAQADDYRTLAVPLMAVSGIADEGGGDALPALRPAGPANFGLTIATGGRDVTARFARAAPAITLFVEGYGLGRSSARRRLRHWAAATGDAFTVRRSA